jgi:hypothetical protein
MVYCMIVQGISMPLVLFLPKQNLISDYCQKVIQLHQILYEQTQLSPFYLEVCLTAHNKFCDTF